jgi:5,10-methylenetetrahydrofolate reductase
MISVSRGFHTWCGLIPSQEILCGVGPSLSSSNAQRFASNLAYLKILQKYQLNLEDKIQLKKQMNDAISNWKASWFTTSRSEDARNPREL